MPSTAICQRWRTRRWVLLLVGAIVVIPDAPPPAGASYSAHAAGAGRAGAMVLPTPSAPTIISVTNVAGLWCRVRTSWTAPPAGQSYTIHRTIGSTTTTIAGPTTTADTADDDVWVASMNGAPLYTSAAALLANSGWTSATSIAIPATACSSPGASEEDCPVRRGPLPDGASWVSLCDGLGPTGGSKSEVGGR